VLFSSIHFKISYTHFLFHPHCPLFVVGVTLGAKGIATGK